MKGPPSPRLRRVGLFGGSFNPIHSGHVGIAERARSELGLDRVLFIPAKENPFRIGASGEQLAGGMSDEVRWRLVERVCAEHPGFEAWDIDLKRGEGPSYAIDTVRAAQARFPGAELFWIIGEDNVEGLPRWKDWETLRTLARFVPYPRTVESSTEIRRRLVAGEPLAELVPECVAIGLREFFNKEKK